MTLNYEIFSIGWEYLPSISLYSFGHLAVCINQKGFAIVECASCQKAFNPIHAMYFVLNVITEIYLVKVWSLQGFFTWCKVELEWHRSRNTDLFIFHEDDQNLNMPINIAV